MMLPRSSLGGAVVVLAAWSAFAGAAPVGAQQQWLNSPLSGDGQPVFPFFEGWYDNGDGTFTPSFGYLNRNPRQVLEIPRGERNYMEPSSFDGAQPTYFLASRQRGVFALTITAAQRDQDVWWHLIAADGSDYKVPGRARSTAYQLDHYPRPHGSLSPLAWFTSERDAGRGPLGVWAEGTLTTRVGAPVTLSVSTRDPSVRDTTEARFKDPIAVRVVWSKYFGPAGEVTFSRDSSTPEPPPPPAGRGGRGAAPPGPDEVTLRQGSGTARVVATFPVAGEYVMRAQVDNWDSPDSTAGDQCCWTNAYVRVRVTP